MTKLQVRPVLRRFLAIPLALAAGWAWASEVQGYDVSKSWEKAVVHVPGNFLTRSVDSVKVDAPLPVVIFMHGCGGIGDHEKKWADFLKSEGFIVVLPNSFAIPRRETNCMGTLPNPRVWRTPVDELRPAEAQYALARAKEQGWADPGNIFLMGHSEGGMASQLVNDPGFAGVIVSGFPCVIRGPIRAPDDVPVLVIAWRVDPEFLRKDGSSPQCSDKPMWKQRTRATEMLMEGRNHHTGYEKAARDAVANFLKSNRK